MSNKYTVTSSAKKEKYFGSVKFFKQTITVIVIAVILGLMGFVAYLLWWNNPDDSLSTILLDPPPQGDGRQILVTPENVDAIRNREKAADTRLSTKMTVEWEFSRWDSPSENAFVENPTTNTRVIYFEVYLEEEDGGLGDMVYDSPYIPLGARLKDFPLQHELSKGEYPAILVYYLVDDDFQVITTTQVSVNITVNA